MRNKHSVPTSGSPIIAAFQRRTPLSATPIPVPIPPSTLATPTTQQANDSSPKEGDSTRHKVHNVLSIADRTKIAAWMTTHSRDHGNKNIISKSVSQFPHLFHSSMKANLMKASRLWRTRHEYVDEESESLTREACTSITRSTHIGVKRVDLKARQGRGRKPRVWVNALHLDMLEEFDRLRKLGVKFNWKTLQEMALQLIKESEKPTYHKFLVDGSTDKNISLCITRRWIQSFTDRYRIVSRARTGKHLLSPEKTEFIHKQVAFHLGCVARAFRQKKWNEDDVENADETHFMINVDNGKTLGFCGDKVVKYADVVSGGEGMTMVVRISGERDAMIKPVFMVFKNTNRSYPIRGVPDDVNGVSYRTGPKGWMDTIVMPQWLGEEKVIRALPNNRKRILYVDRCSGHNLTPDLEEAAKKINTEIRYFPANSTDLVQPADSFIIQKIKNACNTRWERYKIERMKQSSWSDSGKVINPGKGFFLRLAALAVRDVNRQRDCDGLTYARKAMIRTGLALNVNGLWEEKQLFPELQQIIAKHRVHFEGQMVEE